MANVTRDDAPLVARITGGYIPPLPSESENLMWRGLDTGMKVKKDSKGDFLIKMLDHYGIDFWEQMQKHNVRFRQPLQKFFEDYFSNV